MSAGSPIKKVLTIAGSDPSGGAGIQADLKTFSALRVYGMAVIAAMTAQSSAGVSAVAEVEPGFIAEQLNTLLTDIRPDATKTGMLLTEGVIETVGQKVKLYGIQNLVVDPVMISTSGAALMNPDALASFRRALLPLALIITPNIDEAAALTGKSISALGDVETAARQIHEMGPRNVLIKGGHLPGDEATDVLFDGKDLVQFRSPRIATRHTHGTGCVLSASIAAHLALGRSVREAVALGKEFVTNAIRHAVQVGRGVGSCDPLSLGG